MSEPETPVRRVLFVCLGNICRSPTGEGLFRAWAEREGVAERLEIDSAGTGDYHLGETPDRRMTEAAARRGYRLHGRARQVTAADFERFDLIVAMDRSNRRYLEALAPPSGARAELRLFSEFLPGGWPEDVPDPYYGGREGFDRVIEMIEAGCAGIGARLLGEERR